MSIIQWIRRDGDMAVLTIFDNDFEREVRVPYRFQICGHCRGSGRSSSYLGAFTQSEWAEQDDDFKEDYMAGRYDQPCPNCLEYPGRILVPDLRALTFRDRRLWKQQVDEEIEYQQLCEMERKMGA